jgi:hypothetical protein
VNKLARIFAVLFSVSLVGGYILYRARATVFPSSKSGHLSPLAEETHETLMPGSKSAAPFTEAARLDEPDKPTTSPAKGFKVLPGSKSAHVIEGEDANVLFGDSTTQPATQPSR